MKKKKNNDSAYFKDWSLGKLKAEAKCYDYMINVSGCYSTKDMQNYDGILNELERRGVEFSHTIHFS